MNNPSPAALEGRKQEQRPANAKTIHCFAKVRGGHLQSEYTDIPQLFETEDLARRDMMAPMESYVYPMTLLPTEDHALLLEQNAEMREALEPIARFIEAWDRKPHAGIADEFYGIHTGTEWEACLKKSDLRTALTAAEQKIEEVEASLLDAREAKNRYKAAASGLAAENIEETEDLHRRLKEAATLLDSTTAELAALKSHHAATAEDTGRLKEALKSARAKWASGLECVPY